ncbi:MAG: Cell division protein FtsW [Myxococcaceae bacterium]|nr:Cell division protein FtsW [Myxococcaceae bacterium]
MTRERTSLPGPTRELAASISGSRPEPRASIPGSRPEPRASVVPRNRRSLPPKPLSPARPTLVERFVALSDSTRWPKVVGPIDGVLCGTVIALIVFGVVMVYSASSVRAQREFGDGHHYLVRQALYASVGIPLLLLLARVDYHRYRAFGKLLLVLAAGMLVAVIAGLGHQAGGAARWIPVGPIHVQPAEITKIALIIWLADSLANKSGRMSSFKIGFLPHVLIASGLVVLCMAQPDFGSSVILMLLTFILLFTAGAKIGYMLAGAAIVTPVAMWLVTSSEYRQKRWDAFLDPLKYRMTGGYQIVESWMSFGAGGLTGVGLGDSKQKLLYLPEAHTDFIAAIVAEELGFVGFCALVCAFLVLVFRGVRASLRAVDDFGVYLGIGFTLFIGIQALTNLSVVLGLLPTKGLTLPFLSSGGSSLLVNCAAVGILLNVSRRRQSLPQGKAKAAREPNDGESSLSPVPTEGTTRRASGGSAREFERDYETDRARALAAPARQMEGGAQ